MPSLILNMASLSGLGSFGLSSFHDSAAAGDESSAPSTQELLSALRSFLYDLRTEEAIDRNFVPSLKQKVARFEEQTRVNVRVSVARSWPRELPSSVAANLHRVLEEALNNARLHGRADEIAIRLQAASDSLLEIVLTDNGSASNQLGENRFRGVGTLGLRDRVNALGGELRVESGPAGSTRVRITFPRTVVP